MVLEVARKILLSCGKNRKKGKNYLFSQTYQGEERFKQRTEKGSEPIINITTGWSPQDHQVQVTIAQVGKHGGK